MIMTVSSRQCSASLCFVGCVLLVPSCILLIYPKGILGLTAIIGLIIACLCLTVAAALDLYEAYIRLRDIKDIVLINKTRRDINTKLYQIFGAVFFLTASIMYLPFLATKSILGTTVADLGTWVFRFGSFAYLGSSYRSIDDLIKSVQIRSTWLKQDVIQLIAIMSFVWGALFYILGGIAGQLKIGDPSLMSKLWVTGSVGFAVGSFIFLITVSDAKNQVTDYLR